MRLTADIILRARAHINALKDRELDLRGYKIPLIENLGVTQDQFDTLDLSDNEIKKLDNFPRLKRVKTLLLNNNNIVRISPDVGSQIAQLQELILTNNKLLSLSEIDNLAGLSKLSVLSLIENPVSRQPQYRMYTIYKLPNLKVLDFKPVTQEERQSAAKLFKSAAGKKLEEQALAEANQAQEEEPVETEKKLTPEQRATIMGLLEKAKTPEDVDRLERMLKTGIFQLPPQAEKPAAPPIPAAPTPTPTPAVAAPMVRPPTPEPVVPSHPSPTPPSPPPQEEEVEAQEAPLVQDAMEVEAPQEEEQAEEYAEVNEGDQMEEEQGEAEQEEEAAAGDAGFEPSLSEEQIQGFKVVELKEQLKMRGLPASGNKADLQEKLRQAVAEGK